MKNLKDTNRLNLPIALGIATIIVFFPITAIISYNNIQGLKVNAQAVAKTHDTISSLQILLSSVKDAETGQRGYVITGDEQYLAPYNKSLKEIDNNIATVEGLSSGSQELQNSINIIKQSVAFKLDELAETIETRRTKGLQPALDLVRTDRGKQTMDNIRSNIASIEAYEQDVRAQHMVERDRTYKNAILNAFLICAIGVSLSILFFFFIRRHHLANQRQAWLKDAETKLSKVLVGNLNTIDIGNNILQFLHEQLGIQAGAFYVQNGNGFKLVSTYGVRSDANIPERFGENDGLLAQAAYKGKTLHVDNVPDNYLSIGSSLGQSKPKYLVVIPSGIGGVSNAVIEVGSFHKINKEDFELLQLSSEAIGLAVRAAEYRSHLQDMYEETERQSEELQTQTEELRVSNEELEEQGRALKESQSRLEQQQFELEQINTQLESQTQELSLQKSDLERAHVAVQIKASEVEKASQYKSDFLANMSHELRTPLNSSLILAKLLADNPQGNLTAEQVKFATTIQSSGNDLLTLINDILDLSKIESGYMEMSPESFSIKRLSEDLKFMFEPMAKEKGLNLIVKIAPDCPITISTDKLRLEQVIKNLLSNAIKFTKKGHVEFNIVNAGPDKIAFSVKDTGIGISEEQQQIIFDPFRQADGTTSRKYGGTGLGLSISRELTKLLGGTITLSSAIDEGSNFVIQLPLTYEGNLIQSTQASGSSSVINYEDFSSPARLAEKPSSTTIPNRMDDDRDTLSNDRHCILVIEDDSSFARIIYDLAHELNFDCLIAETAEEGIAVTKQYLPNAIILDVGLPDNSGLSVLDRLKRNPHTRHIPIHVVSANDYTKTAMSLGAFGYMLKPVKREQLADTLRQMENRFSQTMRRIILVEDDEVQRESMKHLLKAKDVEIIGVGTAAECLEKLENENFDCMVLDLSLPDASGHSLLETLSSSDTYSFPPVIVYTGRDLSSQEEQDLQRYSQSIIIKGAKSPERLLDEVTLFLHQVVTELPPEQQNMLKKAQNRDSILENRSILIVEDDVRNIYSLTNILEPHGVKVQIARNGIEALDTLQKVASNQNPKIDMILMDVMMPEMDGITATREIRKNGEWKKLPIIMLTAKAMRDDQERCLAAGANDYMAKPLDVEKLLSLVRVWMPR